MFTFKQSRDTYKYLKKEVGHSENGTKKPQTLQGQSVPRMVYPEWKASIPFTNVLMLLKLGLSHLRKYIPAPLHQWRRGGPCTRSKRTKSAVENGNFRHPEVAVNSFNQFFGWTWIWYKRCYTKQFHLKKIMFSSQKKKSE